MLASIVLRTIDCHRTTLKECEWVGGEDYTYKFKHEGLGKDLYEMLNKYITYELSYDGKAFKILQECRYHTIHPLIEGLGDDVETGDIHPYSRINIKSMAQHMALKIIVEEINRWVAHEVS